MEYKMDKNKKKFFLKYIANLSLIAMCTFFLNTNVIFAEGQEGADENTNIYLKKCTDLYRVDGNLTLDDDLDYVEKYLEKCLFNCMDLLAFNLLYFF